MRSLTLSTMAVVLGLIACSQSDDPAAPVVANDVVANDVEKNKVVASDSDAQLGKISHPGEYAGYAEAKYDGYQLSSQYIPMRDGTKIAIDIFRPTAAGVVAEQQLPVLWMHTPYNRRNYRTGGLTGESYPGKALKLSKYGYIVAIADFRGLFASFGHNAGYNRGEWQDASRMDAYDITEWLAQQPWSSGKIGMWGCSATGGSQMQALSVAPPSLTAVFPMSCEWDVYPFANFGGMSPPQGEPTRLMRGGSRAERDKQSVAVDGDDDRSQLNAAIAEHVDNIETAGYTSFRDSVAEKFSSEWWLKSSPYLYKDVIEASGIAMYSTMNLDEEGPGYGPAFTFNNLNNPRKFIIGPATHCDWTTVEQDTGFDILVEELRFFDYWLKGIANGVMKEAPVTYYTYNLDKTDINNPGWQTASAWPLPSQQLTEFYLGVNSLSTESAETAAKIDVTVDYDFTHDNNQQNNQDNFWAKGLQFSTEALTEDVQISGHPVLRLWLSSSVKDADVVARIDDVAADGSATYRTVEGRLRASLRKLAEPPYNNLGLPYHPFTKDSVQPLVPGEAVELQFDFYAISNVFKRGHKIRLTLNFADQRATKKINPAPTVTIHHGGDRRSALILPVIPRQ